MSDSVTPWTVALQAPWGFPGKNTIADCHFLPLGVFPNQRSSPCLLCLPHWQVYSLPLSYLGSPLVCSYLNKSLSRWFISSLPPTTNISLSKYLERITHTGCISSPLVSTSQSTVVWLRLLTTSYMLNQMDPLQGVSPMTFLQHLALLLCPCSSVSSVYSFPLASETAAFTDFSCSACFFFFISEHLGRFSPGSPLSQKIIFPLVYALPWLQLTLLCWWATIANLQPDFSSELHTGISNNRLLEVDILWTLHIHYSLSPWCFYTNRV